MHRVYANEMHSEKARWELHKNAMYCFEQFLKPTCHKTGVMDTVVGNGHGKLTSNPG